MQVKLHCQYTAHSHSVHSTFPLPCTLPGNNAPEYTVNQTMHQNTLSITQCTRIHCQSHNAPEYTVNPTMHQNTLSIAQCTRIHCQSMHQRTLSIAQYTRIHCQLHNVYCTNLSTKHYWLTFLANLMVKKIQPNILHSIHPVLTYCVAKCGCKSSAVQKIQD